MRHSFIALQGGTPPAWCTRSSFKNGSFDCAMRINDGHSQCLICLGVGHITECCSPCCSFSKRTVKNRELKLFLLERTIELQFPPGKDQPHLTLTPASCISSSTSQAVSSYRPHSSTVSMPSERGRKKWCSNQESRCRALTLTPTLSKRLKTSPQATTKTAGSESLPSALALKSKLTDSSFVPQGSFCPWYCTVVKHSSIICGSETLGS